jgi:diguanylate cyclase (GGDEF)-like protein
MDIDRLKILIVDDDEDDFIMTRDLLSEVENRTFDVEWAPLYDTALELISTESHDVYLFDYRLGARTGLDLLHEAISLGCKAPIILLTGQGDHEIDILAMKAGAMDYLQKDQINAPLLERSIRYALERKRTEDDIFRMAFYDNLTALPNRVLFQDRLEQALAQSERVQNMTAVMFLDVDNFKRINDTFGHYMGDQLLKGIANRLSNTLRKSDSVTRQSVEDVFARMGGDEFTVLLSEIKNTTDAAKVAQRILNILSQPFILGDHELFVSTSIGIAVYPHDGKDTDDLLKNADAAMYYAKEKGKNNYQYYKKSMNASALDRLTLENDLRKALEQEEFTLFYQPRLHIKTGEVVGMEALIRWNHPERGLVSPGEFIPLAEETGLILLMDEWVLKTACKQNKSWQEAGYPPKYISVNLSGQQFKHESLIRTMSKTLTASGLDPQYLELEITESAIMKNADSTLNVLNELKKMGVKLSMDDFGTGYSSFNYLKSFPLDIIKIDRSFIMDITEKNEVATIVKAIIAMAQSLRLSVVAEGVETDKQLSLLRELDCDEMQGYLISRPVHSGEIVKFFVENANEAGISS